jgi:hypothetical protein
VVGLPDTTPIYEAENATLSGAVVARNQAGYSGTGFADYVNATGDYVEWSVSAPSAGAQMLKFRYANGGSTDRPLELKVNGVVVNSSLSFPPTGGWTTWVFVSSSATFNSGNNTVRLTTVGSSGPNVDLLRAFSSSGAPPAPTGLTAIAQKSPGKIKLTWTQSSGPGITQNKVYRSTTGSGGPYTLRTTLSATTTYTDTGLTSGATYYYVVTAVNSGGESPYSNSVGATAK